jgi:predicted SAM-dependent methyltransferase
MEKGQMTARSETILRLIDRSMTVLEIGGSYNPLVPKSQGWNSFTADHSSKDDLITKYRGMPDVDVKRIENVDFVWNDGRLDQAIPASCHGTFDACIASHVIEHIPDLIGFFKSLEALLKPGGLVCLAVPDKRYCFDYFRPTTTTGDLLTAHQQLRVRHTKKTAFDFTAYSINNNSLGAWGQHKIEKLTFCNTLAEAKSAFDSLSEGRSETYVDFHAWQFTPASFELNLLELYSLGILKLRIEDCSAANGCEFYTNLRNQRSDVTPPEALQARRLQLLQSALIETKDQIDYLLSGRHTVPRAGQPQDLSQPSHQTASLSLRERGISQAVRPLWVALLPLRRVITRLRGRI